MGQTLLVVAVVAWCATLAYEVWRDADVAPLLQRVTGGAAGDDILLIAEEEDVATEQEDTARLLPTNLDGWLVQGVQQTPGSPAGVAEAHFSPGPQDEQRSLAMPLSVYVRVSSVEGSGVDHIDRQLATRYTDDQEQREVSGQEVSVGRTPDRGSFYVAWERDGRFFEVDASFRYRIPASGGDSVIEGAALEVAAAVMAHRPGQGGAE